MITIEQLLESVDLDFEPGWVTKDSEDVICIWKDKPEAFDTYWSIHQLKTTGIICYECLKLSEFENKHWSECIYEVPRKTTGKIEKLTGALNGKRKIVFPSDVSQEDIISKLHEVIDAVNELKGAKNE